MSTEKRSSVRTLVFCCLLSVAGPSIARGVSPYIPLKMAPEIEREVFRLFSLAGMPKLKRPFFAADVDEALQRACAVPSSVCTTVSLYLERYKKNLGLTDASVLLKSDDEVLKFVPNQRGMPLDSQYGASFQAYWQFGSSVLATVSGVGYEDEFIPTGFVSLGFDALQVDIGWREHWWSPFRDSATLLSTNARPSPSITVSNYRPLTFLNFRYEVFYADLEETDGILFQGQRSSGSPGLFGVHLGISPVPGFSIAVNRVMQFGGDGRSKSLSTLLKAFFDPAGADNIADLDEQAGNQIASITSRFDYAGKFPFSVYMEFAGEDTSTSNNIRLGNTALSLGIFLPQLTPDLDVTYEYSEFQNGWYINTIYANGYTNDGSVMGHWVGNEREFGDAVGTETHTLLVNWEFAPGNLVHASIRTIANADYSAVNYVRGHELLLRYSRAFSNYIVGIETYVGRTTLDEDFVTVGGFWRW